MQPCKRRTRKQWRGQGAWGAKPPETEMLAPPPNKIDLHIFHGVFLVSELALRFNFLNFAVRRFPSRYLLRHHGVHCSVHVGLPVVHGFRMLLLAGMLHT